MRDPSVCTRIGVDLHLLDAGALQLQIERQALGRESDAESKERLQRLDEELANVREKSSGLKAQWQSEKAAIKAATSAPSS